MIGVRSLLLNKHPIALVSREVYVPWTEQRGTPVLYAQYLGSGLKREESLRYEVASDWYEGGMVRSSQDNGRTWSDWQSASVVNDVGDGCVKEQAPVAWCYDPVAEKMIRFIHDRFVRGQGPEVLRKLWDTGEKSFYDHGFWQFSSDQGETWSPMQQLCYENERYDPDELSPSVESLQANQMYASYDAIVTRDGAIVYPVAEVPLEISEAGAMEQVEGIRCFIGRWDAVVQAYLWEVSDPVAVPHRVSGRGLLEPAIAELADGRLLLEMRGSTESVEVKWKGRVESQGRRWISVSEDGGRSWSPVSDLQYDVGGRFYSPSAFSSFLRHSRTGKLYWFGNITPTPPKGNLPRYPLYFAEMNESIPALKKETLTVIDDYDKQRDSPEIQFSNFRILEDRETGNIELYMTRYGESKDDRLKANQYKYTITLLDGVGQGLNSSCGAAKDDAVVGG